MVLSRVCLSCRQALYDAIFGSASDGGEHIRAGLLQRKERLATTAFRQLLCRIFSGNEDQDGEADGNGGRIESSEAEGGKQLESRHKGRTSDGECVSELSDGNEESIEASSSEGEVDGELSRAVDSARDGIGAGRIGCGT